jgi:hypothetical protein
MDGMSVESSPAALFNNDQVVQNRNRDGQTPAATPQQEPPRVNEGPSTVTTLSPQAQQLARSEGAGSVPPADAARNQSRAPEGGQDSASNPSAQQANNGRAFDDRSTTGTLLRN